MWVGRRHIAYIDRQAVISKVDRIDRHTYNTTRRHTGRQTLTEIQHTQRYADVYANIRRDTQTCTKRKLEANILFLRRVFLKYRRSTYECCSRNLSIQEDKCIGRWLRCNRNHTYTDTTQCNARPNYPTDNLNTQNKPTSYCICCCCCHNNHHHMQSRVSE